MRVVLLHGLTTHGAPSTDCCRCWATSTWRRWICPGTAPKPGGGVWQRSRPWPQRWRPRLPAQPWCWGIPWAASLRPRSPSAGRTWSPIWWWSTPRRTSRAGSRPPATQTTGARAVAVAHHVATDRPQRAAYRIRAGFRLPGILRRRLSSSHMGHVRRRDDVDRRIPFEKNPVRQGAGRRGTDNGRVRAARAAYRSRFGGGMVVHRTQVVRIVEAGHTPTWETPEPVAEALRVSAGKTA